MSRTRLLVVGGGAAGLAAARAGARKADTTLVTAGPLGGDCTWTGCVPSKTLLEASAAGLTYRQAHARLVAARERIAATEDEASLGRDGIAVVHGHATFTGPSTVEVTGEAGSRTLHADRVVLATGAGPSVPPVPGLRGAPYLTNETLFELPELPASLAVLGGGAIGCEIAFALARFGCAVTLVEAADRILGKEEPEAAAVVQAALEQASVRVLAGTPATEVSATDGGVTVRTEGAGDVVAERLLVAVGRTPATEGLGLDAAGIATEHGVVSTDDTLRTSVPGVWAAGDVTGRLQLTHAGDAMGRLAAGNALARRGRKRYSSRATPWVTFTDPEVARVGLTEADAAARVRGARVAYLPMAEVDRAVVADRTEGFVKIVAGPRRLTRHLGGGRVLGATVVAPRAGEMIAEVALAMHLDAFAGRLAQATHAYPTWGTAVQVAAAQLVGELGGRTWRPARGPGR